MRTCLMMGEEEEGGEDDGVGTDLPPVSRIHRRPQ